MLPPVPNAAGEQGKEDVKERGPGTVWVWMRLLDTIFCSTGRAEVNGSNWEVLSGDFRASFGCLACGACFAMLCYEQGHWLIAAPMLAVFWLRHGSTAVLPETLVYGLW